MPRPDVERGEGRGEYGMLPCYVDSGAGNVQRARSGEIGEMSDTGTCSYISLSHTHVTKCVGVSLWPCSFLCDSCGLGGVCSPPSANARTCADAATRGRTRAATPADGRESTLTHGSHTPRSTLISCTRTDRLRQRQRSERTDRDTRPYRTHSPRPATHSPLLTRSTPVRSANAPRRAPPVRPSPRWSLPGGSSGQRRRLPRRRQPRSCARNGRCRSCRGSRPRLQRTQHAGCSLRYGRLQPGLLHRVTAADA